MSMKELRRTMTDEIFTDFSKAFDKVDHGILLQKPNRFGIRGQIFNVYNPILLVAPRKYE